MVTELRLQHFRCFESLNLVVPPRGALIVGNNAQGKTSILEAVCMLTRLQSPRIKRPKPMVKVGEAGFGIAGECWGSERQVRYGRGGLVMQVDGEVVQKQADYFRAGGLIVWMGNDDLDLVRGASETRRRYLDFLGSQMDPMYRQAMSRYKKALKLRNLLLKESRDCEAEIAAYDEILITSGDYLVQARDELVKSIEPLVQEAQHFVGAGSEKVGLEYRPSAGVSMREALQQTHEKDRRRGQTMVGPHRDDLKLCLNDLSASDYASEGQQRTLALALKLGQGTALQQRTQQLPVYLLDDIFGELDIARRNAVMDFLPEGAQVLITTTHLDWLDEKWDSWKRLNVIKGEVL